MPLFLLLLSFLAQLHSSPDSAREQAKTALEEGHFQEAKQLSAAALQSNENDPALWFYLGVSCNGLNQFDEAISAFETAHKLAPDNPDVDFDLGLLYWRGGDIAKAKQAYMAGLAHDAGNKNALENYALLLIKTGESEKAIAPLMAVKKLDPLSLSARVSLIECYVKANRKRPAEEETNELLRSRLAGFDEQTKLAAILIEDGDLELAETVLQSSLRLNSAQPKAYAALGLVYLNQKRFKDAANSFESAVQLQPDSAEYAMAFANALVLWSRPRTLLEFLNSVQAQFGDRPEFQHKLAFAYYSVGNLSKSVETLQNLLHGNPKRQDQIYFLLASSYFGMGKLDESESAYRKAIALNPKEPLYYTSYATMLRNQGPKRVDDALSQLNQAAQLTPHDPAVLLQLGLCFESKGDAKLAVDPLEHAVKVNPDLLPARVALARVYFKLGRKIEGEAEKTRVAELESRLQKQQSVASSPLAEAVAASQTE